MAKFTDMEVFVGARTDKAAELTFFPDTKHEKEIWVPLSVLEDADVLDATNADGKVDVSIAKWFLKKNDIEYDTDGTTTRDTYDNFSDRDDDDMDDSDWGIDRYPREF